MSYNSLTTSIALPKVLIWGFEISLGASNYLDKLAHEQVFINSLYSVAQMCTGEDMFAYISGAPSIDDVMSYNLLTTLS